MFVFRENGLENVITLVKGKAEEVTLPVDKVKKNISYFVSVASCLSVVVKSLIVPLVHVNLTVS